MKYALRKGSCATSVYLLIKENNSLTLDEIYRELNGKWANSSIRRAIYELRDSGIVYKREPDIWVLEKEMQVLSNVSGYQ